MGAIFFQYFLQITLLIKKVKFFKSLKSNSFLDEAFGFIGYAGLNPAYIKSKSKAKNADFDFDFICGV
jgi:hypothetical protein